VQQARNNTSNLPLLLLLLRELLKVVMRFSLTLTLAAFATLASADPGLRGQSAPANTDVAGEQTRVLHEGGSGHFPRPTHYRTRTLGRCDEDSNDPSCRRTKPPGPLRL
jgi:hypothetical protein